MDATTKPPLAKATPIKIFGSDIHNDVPSRLSGGEGKGGGGGGGGGGRGGKGGEGGSAGTNLGGGGGGCGGGGGDSCTQSCGWHAAQPPQKRVQ